MQNLASELNRKTGFLSDTVLLDREEGFQLYIKLFALELQPADLYQIQKSDHM